MDSQANAVRGNPSANDSVVQKQDARLTMTSATILASPPASPQNPAMPSHFEKHDMVPSAPSSAPPDVPKDPRLQQRNVPRKSVYSLHEQSFPLNDIDEHSTPEHPYPSPEYSRDTDSEQPEQGTAEHYQQHLPRFSGRITSVQSFDSRHLQTPSPDLMISVPTDDPLLRPSIASPSFMPQHFIPDHPPMQPLSAVISSGESNRSSKDSSNFEIDDLRQTDSPISNLSSQDGQSTKLYPQLQYHHEQFAEGPSGQLQYADQGNAPVSTLDPRAADSRSTSSPSSDGQRNGRLLAPQAALRRNSRTSSTYSMSPDSRGRSSASPQQRAVSGSSYDSRKSSYIDLTIPQHMQAPPPAASTNTNLRELIGSNAALLSSKQTLELYRQNAKKSQDPMLQYELALFMIQAVQQQDLPVAGKHDSPYSAVNDAQGTRKELLKEARSLLTKLARNLPQAQYYLADAYTSGLFNNSVSENEKAFPLFVAASKHGHAEAGYRAALSYEFGWGCGKDPSKAVQFYRQAASKSHPGAMTRLGMACLRKDLGLLNKHKEGVKWLKRATDVADEQYPAAPYELGLLHEAGFEPVILQDHSYAAQLYTQAAELGHADAFFKMGDAYEHGKLSCPRDAALSVHFYTGAAQRGHPLAMMALCAWYLVGAEPVLEKNEDEAYQWALKASEYGMLPHHIFNRWGPI